MAIPGRGTMTAAEFIEMANKPPQSQSPTNSADQTPANGVPKPVVGEPETQVAPSTTEPTFEARYAEAGRIGQEVRDTEFSPTKPVRSPLQNERSTIGSVLEALATAADPSRGATRAERADKIAIANAELEQRDNALKLQYTDQRIQALDRQNMFMLQVMSQENISGQQVFDMMVAGGIDGSTLSAEAMEGLAQKTKIPVATLMDMFATHKERGDLDMERARLQNRATEAGIAGQEAQTEYTKLQAGLMETQQAMMDIDLRNYPGKAGIELQILQENLTALREAGDMRAAELAKTKLENSIRGIDLMHHDEHTKALIERIKAETNMHNARASAATTADDITLAQATQIQQTVLANYQATLGELKQQIEAGAIDTTTMEGRQRVANIARTAWADMNAEYDPESFRMKGDVTGMMMAENFYEKKRKILQQELQDNYGIHVPFDRTEPSPAQIARMEQTTAGRTQRAVEAVQSVGAVGEMSESQVATIVTKAGADWDVDPTMGSRYVTAESRIRGLPFVTSVTTQAPRGVDTFVVGYDTDAMEDAGMSPEDIAQYRRDINIYYDQPEIRESIGHARRFRRKMQQQPYRLGKQEAERMMYRAYGTRKEFDLQEAAKWQSYFTGVEGYEIAP